jgi:hypothetical protein
MFEPQEINIAVTGGEAQGAWKMFGARYERTVSIDADQELGRGLVADHKELTIRSSSAACGPIKNRSVRLSVRRWVCPSAVERWGN